MSMSGGEPRHQPDMPNPRGGTTRTDPARDPANPSGYDDGRRTEQHQGEQRPKVPRPDRDPGEVPTHEEVVEPLSSRHDRIRWGAVWAGLVVAIATFIVLQLLFIAVEAIDLTAAEQADAWWTAAAAVLAFVLGGVTAGASTKWANAIDGLLHGTIMWAVAVAAILLLSVLGGGALFGALDATGAFDQITVDLEEGTVDGVGTVGADDSREAASWALLGLGVAWAAAAIGALLGATIWPPTREVPGLERRTAAR